MYKIQSDLAQRRARQLWLADLQTDSFLSLSPEQQRDSLKAKMKAIEASLLALPKGAMRDELGKVKLELQNQMSAIRKSLKAPGAARFFVDVARERLSKAQFQALMMEAAKRALAEKEPTDSASDNSS